MKRLLTIAAMTAALLASAAPALAYSPVTCVASLLQVVCIPRGTAPNAKVIGIDTPSGEYRDPDVTDADRASWANRCKPRRAVVDGTERWLYATPGCADGPRHEEGR